ncbi:leucine-rich repeat protein [Muricauda sp. SCSIO 64092]|uniref:leucine-rich repeat domain-containing protein n=1 Tax=Allomuricauda sp. SCSIO 64092 TaxID=2908842 RepID=UPI001FF341C9|nr:leucine-rich repeat domain-containing protein [Muricauda sp. SCSIO 64092]UOY07249.1 leucine-rich repeat protein [Muricauda sp. SCSIO 64092]
MKKQLHLMIATIFVVLVGISSYGQQFTVDGIRYEITATAPAQVEVVDYIGATTEVTIPSTVRYQLVNYAVTAIGKDAFRYNQLTSVTIPNSVTRIESHAFAYNNLTEVTIPSGLDSIGERAFAYNNLTEVTIPNGLTTIGDFAFYNNQLTSVTLPNSVTSIGDSAFLDNKLTNVTIPNGVTSIEDGAFAFNQLASVTIPNGVTSIGNSAFLDNKLNSVTIPESVTRIDEAAFMANQLQGHLEIPNSVASIGPGAFYINQLTSIKIPSSVTFIGQHAFTDNLDLHLVMVERDSPPTLHEKAFKDLTNRSQIDLIVPKDRVQAYLHGDWTGFKSITEDVVDDTFISDNITYKITETVPDKEVAVMDYDTSGGTSVDIPPTANYQGIDFKVTAIGKWAFYLNNLTSVTLPNTLTRIGDNAFQYNQLKGHLEIPNSVTSIGSHAFGDNQLTRVTIPEGVTHIGEATFAVNQLTSVTLPNSLETIGNYAFQNNQLTRVTIPNNVTSIGTHAFQNNQLTEVTLPNNLTSIGNSAFWHNDLTGVTLPVNVTRIDQWAFWDNLNLVTVRAKSTNDPLPTLDKDAFKNRGQIDLIVPKGRVQAYSGHPDWTGFKSITEVAVDDTFVSDDITYKITEIVPDKEVVVMDYDTLGGSSVDIPPTVNYQGIDFEVTNIGEAAFAVNQLTSVTIPNSVTRISNYAFQSNQLTEVNLPNNLTSIGTHAFQNNQLTSVTLPNSLKTIGNSAFWDNDLTEVTLPVNVTRIDQWAFWDNLNLAMVTVKADSPPTLDKDAFKNRDLIHLIVPKGKKDIYLSSDWTDFKSITEDVVDDTFISDNITYKIIEIVPDKEVAVMDYDTLGGSSVDIPPTAYYQGIDFKVTSIDNQAFMSKNLIEVNIPDGVTRIGHSAFQDNQLTSVTIPDGVTHILDDAFSANMNLNLVTVKANDPPDIQESTFTDRDQIDLVVPKGRVPAYSDHPDWTGFKSITEDIGIDDTFISDNITYKITKIVPDKEVAVMDYDTSGGTMVTISPMVAHGPNTYTVTAIGKWAFYVNNLTSVTIPNTVTGIGESAFENNQLTRVVIPNGVMDIGKDAFYGNQLTSVELPTSVDSLGQRAFGDNQLDSVAIPDGVTRIEKWTFAENDLKEVTIPGLVESIGFQAFYDNPNLGLVRVKPNDPPALDADAFQNPGRDQIDLVVPKGKRQDYIDADWTGFRSITEPAEHGDIFIVDNISYEITSLTSYKVKVVDYGITGGTVTIPPTANYQGIDYEVTAIGEGAFYQSGLTSVEIPNTVTSIEHFAFHGNALTEVTIPNSVTSIVLGAFWNNSNLTTVVIEATNPPLYYQIFGPSEYVIEQIDLIVPAGTWEAYFAAGWHGFKSITEAPTTGKSAVVQGTSPKASPLENVVAPAHVDVAKANARNNVSVYPNPAQDEINIGLPDGEALRQVKIYNALGVHVHSANTLQMDISHLSSGTYIMEIETRAGERVVKRILVK